MDEEFFKSSPRVARHILRPQNSRIVVHLHQVILYLYFSTFSVTSSSVKMKYLYPGALSLQHGRPHSISDNEQRKEEKARQGKVTNLMLNLPGKCETQKSVPPLRIQSKS